MVRVPDAKSDCSRQGEAEVRILDFKTTWSEFQRPSQTAPAEAELRCVYSILKPHGLVRVPDAKSDYSCRGEAEVRILKFKTTLSEFHHLPRVGPKQLCALAHLGCTLAAGTS